MANPPQCGLLAGRARRTAPAWRAAGSNRAHQDVGVLGALDGLLAAGGLQRDLVGHAGGHARAAHGRSTAGPAGAGQAGRRGAQRQGHCARCGGCDRGGELSAGRWHVTPEAASLSLAGIGRPQKPGASSAASVAAFLREHARSNFHVLQTTRGSAAWRATHHPAACGARALAPHAHPGCGAWRRECMGSATASCAAVTAATAAHAHAERVQLYMHAS